jgi:hypothetical protein
VLRQPTTAVHASHAQQKLAHLHHVGKTALRAPSIVTHARHVTRVIHATLAQLPVATSAATGAQHLLPAAASFRPTTAHLALSTETHVTRTSLAQPVLSAAQPLLGARATTAQPELLTAMPVRHAHSIVTHVQHAMGQHHVVSKTDLHALSIVTHAHRVTHVMVAHLVVSKIVRPELLTVIHAQRATHATVAHLVASKTARPELLTETHVRRATHAMAAHVRHLALSIAQTHAGHASSMTAHASSTATTATTAPTVVQTALTV